ELDDLIQLVLEGELLTQSRDAALEPERGHGDSPTTVHGADDVVGGGARALEEHLAEFGSAGELADRTDFDSALSHRYQEIRETLVPRSCAVCAAEREAPIGAVSERRPRLLSRDDPLAVFQRRARLHIRQVRAGVGLGISLAPQLAH